ncbi:MAG TPA: invasin domain 3-containing protein [Candidatus Dormibacteraeota bacterium]|nr:invasin domain 3-containing protein [Candidatus Dormibacteraeota bacterium]
MFARKWLVLCVMLLAAIAAGAKVVSQAFASTASQITVQVTLSRSFVPDDGHTSLTANVRVLAGTTTQALRQIEWGILAQGPATATFQGTPPTDTGLLDSATATIVAGTSAGKPELVVTDEQTGQTGTAVINQYGTSSHLTIALSPQTVTADGRSTSVATATATDSAGVGVPVDTVTFSSASDNGGSVKIGAVSNNGDGTYSATITAGTKADNETITAADRAMTASASLAEIPGPAASMTMSLGAATLPSDGTSTTTASATVSDAFGNRRASDTVAFHTDGHVTFGPTVNQGGGLYTSTVTSSTVAGVEHLTAVDGSVSSPAVTLTVTPGPAYAMTLSLGKSTLSTSQSPPDSTTATVTVTDVHGNAVPHDPVTITTNGHAQIGSVAGHGDGTYTATITAGAPGPETITAADANLKNADGSLKTATAPLTEIGPPTQLTLTLNPTHIHVDPSNYSIAAVTVSDVAGDGVPGVTVTFGSDSGVLNFSNNGTGTTDANGQAHVQVSGVTSAGPQTIYVTAANMTTTATLVGYGTPSSMKVAVSPSTITADGAGTALATVTVTDGGGNGVPGQNVTLGRSDTGAAIDPMTDNGDGTYTFSVHSSKTAQTETLTAGDASYHLTATASLHEVPGPATTVTVSPNPGSATADGASTVQFTATVADVNGNPISGEHVSMSSTGGIAMSPVAADPSTGTYTSTATASKVAGSYTVTATDSSNSAHPISGTAVLKLVPGAPTALSVTPGAASVVADGHSTTRLTVHIEDANANGVYGESLTVSGTSDMGSAVVDNGDGTYTVTLTASKTAQVETITITDAAHPALSGSARITETAGPAAGVAVTTATPTISSDQTSGVTFTATVTDVNGNPVKNDTVTFAGTGGLTFGGTSIVGDGTYTATATPSTTDGTKTVTATDTSVSGVSGQTTLVETPGAPVGLTLAQPSGPMVADGTSTMTLLATVTDRNHNGVPGQTLGVTSAVNGGGTAGITSAVADNGDGTYTITLTSGRKADVETVTVTDPAIGGGTTATPTTTASATVTQVAGPAAIVGVALTPNSTVTANDSDQRTVTVTVTDANGNPVAGAPISLAASGAATLAKTSLTTGSDGTASTLVTASKIAGKETITATDTATNVQGAATLTENAGPPASVTASVPAQNLFDDGMSTVAVSAVVKDVNGNPVPNEQVSFAAANGLVSLSPAIATTDATGTAVTTARARTTTGTETITATDVSNSALGATVSLTLTDQDHVATFVKAAYQTILHRNVDANGLAHWGNAIRNGMSRAQLASILSSSSEFRTDVVSHMYPTYLHRAADSAGVSYWVGQIGRGATFEQVELSFIGSPEYFQLHGGTDKGAVDALYKDVLGRSVDPSGEAYWVQQISSGQMTFSQLAASILSSEESRERIVQGFYQNILNRTAPQSDLAYWAGQLGNGARDETIINLFVGSDEYYAAH